VFGLRLETPCAVPNKCIKFPVPLASTFRAIAISNARFILIKPCQKTQLAALILPQQIHSSVISNPDADS
jgi:hypothetical protein